MPIFALGDKIPTIDTSVFVATTATVTAEVTLSENVSVWPGASIRGDEAPIVIGKDTNVQDNAVIHSDPGLTVTIGDGVTIGHGAILHGCTVGANSLIGMGAIILNGARIGRETLVAAGALVSEGKSFPEGVLLIGSPARVLRTLTIEEKAKIRENAQTYVVRAQQYRKAQSL